MSTKFFVTKLVPEDPVFDSEDDAIAKAKELAAASVGDRFVVADQDDIVFVPKPDAVVEKVD